MRISFLTFLISMPPWKYEKLHKAFGFKIVRTELLSGLAEKIYFLDVSKLIEFDPFHLHIRLNVNPSTIYSTWNHTVRVMEVTILRLFEKIWATFPQPDFPVTKRFFFFFRLPPIGCYFLGRISYLGIKWHMLVISRTQQGWKA